MPKIDRQKNTKKGLGPKGANPPKGLDEKRRRDRMLKKAKRYEDAARSREAAMGDKNISYVGDPFIVDGKKFDPAKKFPETYMRPEGAKTLVVVAWLEAVVLLLKVPSLKAFFNLHPDLK